MAREATVSRVILSDQVKDHLLQEILTGRYAPGARIVETRVARELGTSQAPVREALRDLEALGLVEASAFRGARVRRPSADELLEAFAVRAQLESLGARLATPLISDEQLDELAELVAEMHRAAKAGDPHAEAMADVQFHGRIVELSGNIALRRVWTVLEPFSRTYITLVAPGVDTYRIADLHQPVLDALRARQPRDVVKALVRHYREAGSMLTREWPDAGAERKQ
jgi:DNA-binding GntR family transcriptional regulator